MILLLVLFEPLTTAEVFCPSGYTLFSANQKCYKVNENPYPFFAASDACSLEDAELVSIHNAFENSFIAQLIPDNFMDHWIGLTNMVDSWDFTWTDNTAMDYAHWAPTQPNQDNGCVVMKQNTFVWESQSCSNPLPFICIFDPAINRTCPICPTFAPCPTCPPPPVCNDIVSAAKGLVLASKAEQKLDSVCPSGYTSVDAMQRCYKVVGMAATFFAASNACNLDDSELVSIHSLAENQAVGDLLPGADFDKPFWIGLTNLVDQWGQWSWLDDTPVRYANWAPHNPNNTFSCTATHSLGHQWTTESCYLRLPFICEFDPTKSHNCPPCPKPICDDGWMYYNYTNFCYYFGNQSLNNTDAQKECGKRGAYLSSIHSDAENTFIFNQLSSYGPNPYNSAWIGLYRTGSGKTNFANYDETPVDYTNWDAEQPDNAGGNEYCTEILASADPSRPGWPYTNAKWNDLSYSLIADPHYVCKKASNNQ